MSTTLQIKLPKDLSAITLDQYQRYLAVQKNVEEDDNEFLNLKALEIFCGLSLKDSYDLPVSMFESVLKRLSSVFEQKNDLVKRFEMTGSDGVTVEFGMIPNLDKISFGEYIDLEKYITDWSTMHKAMAVLYRPIISGNKQFYGIEPYEGSDKWADTLKDSPVPVALGALVFFYRLGIKLSRYTMSSLVEEAAMNSQLKRDLGKSGVGINLSMDSLEEMSQELIASPKYHYISA